MKRNLFLFFMALLPMLANAYDAEIDGIYYNFSDGEAEVTYKDYGYKSYSGNIVIPTSVYYNNKTYTVTSIGISAFYKCSDLTSITILESVENIKAYAFRDCNSMTSIIIGNGVSSIGQCAFGGCSSLTSITIGSGVTNIGSEAFRDCSGLTSITIPNSVTSIDYGVFYGCSGLNNITLSESLTAIYNMTFQDCTRLTNVTIPEKVTTIGQQAFYGCTSLTSITIPNSVTSIGSSAFYNCSGLTSVTIGNSVTSIGSSSFYGCYRLYTINCLNPVPPTCSGLSTFKCSTDNVRDQYDVYNYATLHVPMGSKEAYSSAYEWRYFNKIKEDMQIDGNVYYANLVVQQGADGYTRQAVKTDEQFTIFIGSYGISRINMVTFNGKDVTSDVVNGYYTTPEIKGESVLSISYEIDTYVNSLSLKDVKVSGYDGEIRISNIDEPSDVCVYSTDGKLVGNVNAALGSATLQVQGEQLYLVKVGSRTYKVAMP